MTSVMHRVGERKIKITLAILSVLSLLGLITACGGTAKPTFSFQGDFLPFAIHYSPPDHITFTGEKSYVTPIGEFSIGAEYELPEQAADSIYVILRDGNTGFDHIYQVHTDGEQFTAVVNGHTIISIVKDQVRIDVTAGDIETVSFKRAGSEIAEEGSTNWFASTWHATNARWDAGWSQSWYHPYGLAKWAYGDSTIEKWYGVGFVWFLLRLVLSIFLALLDTLLTIGFLLGQLAFMIFGPTGRDTIYGLLVLGAIVAIIAGRASELR
jgi:hypothetical protein